LATFTKRGKTWRAEVRKLGVRKSATFNTKAQAIAWATEEEANLNKNGIHYNGTQNHTLEYALQKYAKTITLTKKGIRQEQVRINFLINNLPFIHKPLNKITPQDIASWRDIRLQSVSGASFNRECSLLSHMFEIARKEWNWCSINPIKDIRKPKENPPRDRRISAEEIRLILEVLQYQECKPPITKTQEIAYVFLIALETAMRSGEIVNLTTNNIDLNQKYLTLEQTKNGDKRYVPLSNKAIELLSILINNAKTNNRISLFTITDAVRDVLFRRYRDKIDNPNIKTLHFHDTRHEAITRLAQKLDVLDLARMTGHRNINQLRTYYNATPTEIAQKLD